MRDVTTDVRDLPPLLVWQERFIEKVRVLRLVLKDELKPAGC